VGQSRSSSASSLVGPPTPTPRSEPGTSARRGPSCWGWVESKVARVDELRAKMNFAPR
jgi:hypothetical protein